MRLATLGIQEALATLASEHAEDQQQSNGAGGCGIDVEVAPVTIRPRFWRCDDPSFSALLDDGDHLLEFQGSACGILDDQLDCELSCSRIFVKNG